MSLGLSGDENMLVGSLLELLVDGSLLELGGSLLALGGSILALDGDLLVLAGALDRG